MTVSSSPISAQLDQPSDEKTVPNRKRQRSQSMESDASSSSLKRPVSDADIDPELRSPRPDQLSALSLGDRDIDSYMAEQGEDEIPPHITVVPSHPWQNTPPEQKVAIVNEGKVRPLRSGDIWYLVSKMWWKRWTKACTGEEDKEGLVTQQDLGPVDNSSLLDSHGNLKQSIIEGVDMEYVPEDVWKHFVDWYGQPTHSIPRQAISRGFAGQMTTIELYPPTFKVFRLATSVADSSPPSSITVSVADKLSTLHEKVASLFTINDGPLPPHRIWRIELGDEQWTSLHFPVAELDNKAANLIPDTVVTVESESLQITDSLVIEFQEDSTWLKEVPESTAPQPPTLAGVPPPLFNQGGGFFDRMGDSSNKKATTSARSTSVTAYRSGGVFGSGFSSSWSTVSSLSGKGKKPAEAGTLGLGNMGNTCFMNSAIQCLAHNQELVDYFLTGLYSEELNPDNPLGMQGAIAEAFGDLLRRIWSTTGGSSYSPREFKAVLSRFAPQFSGYQQQDSQELLAFLLDGLHEDLNRVLKKPYVEKPDWEGGGDEELVKLARKSWDGYKLRNDSIIVDLFQGQYQSTLVCPECNKVSITFDPFMYLTLPLPVQKKWKHDIFYVPWDLEKQHVKIPVEINGNSSFKDLRNLVGRWMGAHPENLLTLEIFSNRFYKNLDDNTIVGEMNPSDVIVCFELPCHARQSRAYKKGPDDPFIIPVYLSDMSLPSTSTFRYGQNRNHNLFGYPLIMAVTREEAADVNVMYDTILQRLQRWTKQSRDLFTWEEVPLTPIVPITPDQLVPPPVESVTEIKVQENGAVIAVGTPEEGDIVDEKAILKSNEDAEMDTLTNSANALVPKRIGTKRGVFSLRLQAGSKDFGTTSFHSGVKSWESWERRMEDAEQGENGGVLLHDEDALFCEFDENMKAYYFGEDRKYEHALWDQWEMFEHPEYVEQKRVAEGKKQKGLTLQDCLEEFTKEEKLGEDDLWYCPRCKKHQQATKRFDLWSAPDILVVHLKRFSNNRTLRDKIDVFINFPVKGLDLSNMVGERAAAKRLMEKGVSLEELELDSSDEPLVYDLFGVDEHIGGLGGGHYRAYASNHVTGKWYHFDDTYVTQAKASEAVNANAYLLFYRRRSPFHLGGKSHRKIEEARLKLKEDGNVSQDVNMDGQLPTPPNEESSFSTGLAELGATGPALGTESVWNMRSAVNRSTASSSAAASPSPDLLPSLEEGAAEDLFSDDPQFSLLRQQYGYPSANRSGRASPASDVADAGDMDEDDNPGVLGGAHDFLRHSDMLASGSWQHGMGMLGDSLMSMRGWGGANYLSVIGSISGTDSPDAELPVEPSQLLGHAGLDDSEESKEP